MKISQDEEGGILFNELYNGILLEADPGYRMAVCHRDGVFTYRLKDGPDAEWTPWLDWSLGTDPASYLVQWMQACKNILALLGDDVTEPITKRGPLEAVRRATSLMREKGLIE
jgi:hypothetical protein